MESTETYLTKRPTVPEMEEILGEEFKVLDQGFIRVVDYSGNDQAIVQAARTSYGKGTKKTSEDRGLIRYLMRHRHSTPFEMCEIKLHVRCPMDCFRQWIRHRTANVNEYSTRYSEAIDARQETGVDQWRSQSANNKQGSAGLVFEGTNEFTDAFTRVQIAGEKAAGSEAPRSDRVRIHLTEQEKKLHEHCTDVYNERLRLGVAREQARKDLPLSTYTEAYWKVDLHNLLHFLALRMDSHAQEEIRTYATLIGEKIVSQWVPHTWEAFQDYRMSAKYFSGPEYKLLKQVINFNKANSITEEEDINAMLPAFVPHGWLDIKEGTQELKKHRERDEFEIKLADMGLTIPWRV